MKKVLGLAFVTSVIMPHAFALGPKVIYGEDDRKEVHEASEAHQLLARSTAILIPVANISASKRDQRRGVVQISQTTMKEWLDSMEEKTTKRMFSEQVNQTAKTGITFCEETRFIHQPNPGMCSGFLIAPDLIATAGHCVDSENFCKENRWVFDYQVDKETQKAGVDQASDTVYGCKKVVSSGLTKLSLKDYAIIQLDRRVKGRAPLKIRTENTVADSQSVLVIGGPSGLPTKVTTGGKVRENFHPNYFVTNLDTFQGNSGSAVFNAETGMVEGILVRGEEDFQLNHSKQCIEAKVCASDECRGEDVSRTLSIPEVAAVNSLLAAAVSEDATELNKVLQKTFWIDFSGQDGQSALIKASAVAKNESMKILISKGADVNLQDAVGNTALHELAGILNTKNADALITLVEGRANLEAKNDLGQTPLLIAGKMKNMEAIKLLIKAGANKNAVETNGRNVLSAFVDSEDHISVIELLDMGVEKRGALRNASLRMRMDVLFRKGVAKK